jgi:hypothetical protein
MHQKRATQSSDIKPQHRTADQPIPPTSRSHIPGPNPKPQHLFVEEDFHEYDSHTARD